MAIQISLLLKCSYNIIDPVSAALPKIFEDIRYNSGQVDLQVIRIPLQEDQMPTEYIDTIVDALKNEPASTPCIFSCQMGKGRTTLGMIAAALVKEITITGELKKMTEANLIPEATFKDLVYNKFEKIEVETNNEEVDPYTAGNYDVIKQLCSTCQVKIIEKYFLLGLSVLCYLFEESDKSLSSYIVVVDWNIITKNIWNN